MTTGSPMKHHGVHEVFGFMSKSYLSALKGSFFIIEAIVGFAILASVLLFVVVSLGFLLNSSIFKMRLPFIQ
jgi:hypothetical protein